MIRFGTGGWRAIIGEDFICENIRRVAAGIVALAHEENKTDRPVSLHPVLLPFQPSSPKEFYHILCVLNHLQCRLVPLS